MNFITEVLKLFYLLSYILSEAATRVVLWKKVLLEISQNSQENTYAAVSFLIKLQASDLFLIKLQAWGLKVY